MSGAYTHQAVDLAIVGGGIAGSSLAITMQRAGWTTAIIEREPLYRDRVRGEASHPWGVRELRDLGLEELVRESGARDLPEWTRYRDRQVELSFAWADAYAGSPPEIGFSHPAMQETLLRGAVEAGAHVFRPARTAVARSDDAWILHVDHDGGHTDLLARFLVAADGKTSATRRLWGAEAIADPTHHAFGGMLIHGIDLSQTSSHQGFHEHGFSMAFPQGDDNWRVYLVGPIEMQQRYLGDHRELRYLADCAECFPHGAFASATAVGPLAFFPNAHVNCSRIAGPSAVAIGDAAGAPDPSQGHGMAMVWRDVRVLRELLTTLDLGDVPGAFEQTRRGYETILRSHAAWVAPLTTDFTPIGIALQEQVELARAVDPDALGYASIFALGPDSQPTDDLARSRFFGEHLTANPVRIPTPLPTIG